MNCKNCGNCKYYDTRADRYPCAMCSNLELWVDKNEEEFCIHRPSEDGVWDWQTSCGVDYDDCWNEDDYKEKGYSFCPYCGREIKYVKKEEVK